MSLLVLLGVVLETLASGGEFPLEEEVPEVVEEEAIFFRKGPRFLSTGGRGVPQ